MRPKLRALIHELAALPGGSLEIAITSVLVELRNIVTDHPSHPEYLVLDTVAKELWRKEQHQKLAAKMRGERRDARHWLVKQ